MGTDFEKGISSSNVIIQDKTGKENTGIVVKKFFSWVYLGFGGTTNK